MSKADLERRIADLEDKLTHAEARADEAESLVGPSLIEELEADVQDATDIVKYHAKTVLSAIKTWRHTQEFAARAERTTKNVEG